MRHLFIKKDDNNGFNFSMLTNDHYNGNYRKLDEYLPSEAEIQVISNKKFIIFYDYVYMLEASFLKIFFEDELSKRDSLIVNDIRNDLIFKIKELFSSIKRLYHEEKDNKDRFGGNIVIVSENEILYIRDFSVEVVDQYIDGTDKSILIDDEILGNIKPQELMTFYLNKGKEWNNYLNYPVVYGNTNDDNFTILGIEGDTKEINKEDFICHW